MEIHQNQAYYKLYDKEHKLMINDKNQQQQNVLFLFFNFSFCKLFHPKWTHHYFLLFS